MRKTAGSQAPRERPTPEARAKRVLPESGASPSLPAGAACPSPASAPAGLPPLAEISTPYTFDLEEAVRRCFGKYEIFQKMVTCLFEETDLFLDRMREAIRRGAAAELHASAHRLRNTVAYLGETPANGALRDLENLGRCGELSFAGAKLRDLEAHLDALKTVLCAHRRAGDPQASP